MGQASQQVFCYAGIAGCSFSILLHPIHLPWGLDKGEVTLVAWEGAYCLSVASLQPGQKEEVGVGRITCPLL